jgi:hypothetical protein
MRILCLAVASLLFAGTRSAAADDLENAYQNLKHAETQNDATEVKRFAAEVYALASREITSRAPESDDEKDSWSNRVRYAKGIALQAEYALFATAMHSSNALRVDLIATLGQMNPKSHYLDEAYGAYLVTLSQMGASSKIPGITEKALASFPDNEDLLLVVADSAFTHKQLDRALNCATRLVTVLEKHPKPEGVSAVDWERKRKAALGRGYWIAGVIYAERNLYVNADKELRAALPLTAGNDSMRGAALFYLGVANYQLGKMTLDKSRVLDAARFSEEASTIEGPYSQQAWHNALVSKAEAAKMRSGSCLRAY